MFLVLDKKISKYTSLVGVAWHLNQETFRPWETG